MNVIPGYTLSDRIYDGTALSISRLEYPHYQKSLTTGQIQKLQMDAPEFGLSYS